MDTINPNPFPATPDNDQEAILIVDDDVVYTLIIEKFLVSAGYHVFKATTGTAGMQLLRQQRPSLVLHDVLLPDGNGLDFCRRIKADTALQQTHIILMSSIKISPEDEAAGFRAGADGYISKPFHREAFLARIEAVMRVIQTEARLRESEDRLQLFIAHAPVALAMFDRQMRYMAVSRRWLADYGLIGQDIRGQSHYDIFPEIPDTWKKVHQRGLNGEVIRKEEDAFQRADGRLQWQRWEVRPWFSATGKIGGIVVLTEDISARKEAEAARLATESQFRLLVDSSPEALFIQTQGQFAYINEAGLRLYGATSPRDLLGKPVLTRVHPDWHAAVSARIRLLNEGGQAVPAIEQKHIRLNGEIIDVEVSAVPFHFQGHDGALVFVRDITRRKQAEKALQKQQQNLEDLVARRTRQLAQKISETEAVQQALAESHERLSMVFDSMDALVKVIDLQTYEVLYVNEYGVRTFGHGVGRKCWEIFQKDMGGPCPFCQNHKLLDFRGQPAGPHHWEHQNTITGDWFAAQDKAIPWLDGRLVRLAILTNITRRKEMEERLEAQEELYRGLVESQHDLIVRVDNRNRFTFVNQTYCDTFGKSRKELLGQSFTPLVHEEDIPATLEAMARLSQPPYRVRLEQRAMTIKGWRWLQWEDSAILDEDGRIREIQGVGRDITRLKQVEAELRKTQVRLSLAQTFAHTGVWEYDIAGATLYWSKECEALFGLKEGEFEGTYEAFLARVHPEDRDYVVQVNQPITTMGEGIPLNYEHRILRADGSVRWVRESAGVAFDNEGRPARIVGFVMDITDLKEIQERLVDARAAAEKANEAKSQFLATMSHELRTPMNIVLGFSEILQRDTTLAPEQARNAGLIHTSGQKLLQLINDVLDMSRIEAGQVQLNRTDFHLKDLLKDLETMFQPLAAAKRLQFQLETDPDLPAAVHSDPLRLRQILVNLVGNAIKFTTTGQVALHCRKVSMAIPAVAVTQAGPRPNPKAETTDVLMATVTDTGPGIAEGDLHHIFKAFRQATAGMNSGGTGLGLTISQKYARLMGGDITVTSQEGQGSCFQLTIPLQPATTAPPSERVPRTVVGLVPGSGPWRILLVDDKPDNLMLLRELLQPLGFELQEATNGVEALELFESWQPQAVLMDMRMPVMDGYEATRRIKATPRGQKTPVIAVTAGAFTDNEQAIWATGVDSYVRKPFRQEELFAALEKALGLRYIYAEAANRPESLVRNVQLTPAHMAELPPVLVQMMLQATEDGDMTQLKEVLGEVEMTRPATARGLRELAEQYDYEQLLELLNPVLSQGATAHE